MMRSPGQKNRVDEDGPLPPPSLASDLPAGAVAVVMIGLGIILLAAGWELVCIRILAAAEHDIFGA